MWCGFHLLSHSYLCLSLTLALVRGFGGNLGGHRSLFFWGGNAVGSSEVEGSGAMRGLDRLVYGSLGPNENLKRRQKREADAVTCRNCHVRLIPAHGKVWDMCVRCLTEFHPGWWVIERKRKAKMGSGIRYGDL